MAPVWQTQQWQVAVPAGAELGERPVWDASAQAMIWVDILAGRLHRFRVADGGAARDDEVIVDLGVPIGSAAPRQRRRLRAGHRRRVPADRPGRHAGGRPDPARRHDRRPAVQRRGLRPGRPVLGRDHLGRAPAGRGGAVPAGRRRPDHPHAHRRDGVERHRLEPGRLDHVLHRLGRAAPAGQGVRLRRAYRDDRRRARTHLLSSRGGLPRRPGRGCRRPPVDRLLGRRAGPPLRPGGHPDGGRRAAGEPGRPAPASAGRTWTNCT